MTVVLINLLGAAGVLAVVITIAAMAVFGLLDLTIAELAAADNADHPQD